MNSCPVLRGLSVPFLSRAIFLRPMPSCVHSNLVAASTPSIPASTLDLFV